MNDIIKNIAVESWLILGQMSPYLLFGFLVAGVLSVFISPEWVERHLGGRRIWPLLKASLFGVPLPLCSCGVIPVSMSLHKHGASKGATISFLLSTPQTGADSIFVTFSLLGPVFAVFRPIVAFITGMIGGGLVNIFDHDRENEKQNQHKDSDQCCAEGGSNHKIIKGLKYGFVTLPQDIGKAMLVGLIIAAFISALVPDGYFAEHLGNGPLAMIVMMLVGIPVYVCATASVPIAAALILKGLSPGAAIVFLMTGPATNAASFVTIWKMLGPRTAVIYILTVGGCAIAAGLLLDTIVANGIDIEVVSHPDTMLAAVVKYASAVILIIILAAGIISKKKEQNLKSDDT